LGSAGLQADRESVGDVGRYTTKVVCLATCVLTSGVRRDESGHRGGGNSVVGMSACVVVIGGDWSGASLHLHFVLVDAMVVLGSG